MSRGCASRVEGSVGCAVRMRPRVRATLGGANLFPLALHLLLLVTRDGLRQLFQILLDARSPRHTRGGSKGMYEEGASRADVASRWERGVRHEDCEGCVG